MVASCVSTNTATTKTSRLLDLRGTAQELVEEHEASLFLGRVQHFRNWIRGIVKGVVCSCRSPNLIV